VVSKESFVFDFEKQIWHKYSKTQGMIAENPSWSDVLRVDLAEIAKPQTLNPKP
jgi:hypothetical protein